MRLEKEHHRTGKVIRNGWYVDLKARDLLEWRAKKAEREWLSGVKLSKRDITRVKAQSARGDAPAVRR
jgi:hypothetical protein